MRNSDLPFGAINRQRLGISQVGRTGGRITSVANRKRSNEVMQNISAENLGNQAHAPLAVLMRSTVPPTVPSRAAEMPKSFARSIVFTASNVFTEITIRLCVSPKSNESSR